MAASLNPDNFFGRAVLVCSLCSRITGIRRLSTGFYTDATRMSRGFVWHSDRERLNETTRDNLIRSYLNKKNRYNVRVIFTITIYVPSLRRIYEDIVSFFFPLNIRCRGHCPTPCFVEMNVFFVSPTESFVEMYTHCGERRKNRTDDGHTSLPFIQESEAVICFLYIIYIFFECYLSPNN